MSCDLSITCTFLMQWLPCLSIDSRSNWDFLFSGSCEPLAVRKEIGNSHFFFWLSPPYPKEVLFPWTYGEVRWFLSDFLEQHERVSSAITGPCHQLSKCFGLTAVRLCPYRFFHAFSLDFPILSSLFFIETRPFTKQLPAIVSRVYVCS